MKHFWRALTLPLQWLLALVLLFEEWGWEPLQRAMAWLGRWPGLRWLEARIRSLQPWAALGVLAMPALALLPVKLLALWLMGHGHWMLGIFTIVAAKVLGTAVVARLFTLTHAALVRLAWFAWLYGRWMGWKTALLMRVRASSLWRAGQIVRRRVQARWRVWTRRRTGGTH